MMVEVNSGVCPIRRCQPLGIRCRRRQRLNLHDLRAMIDREAVSATLHALNAASRICRDAR